MKRMIALALLLAGCQPSPPDAVSLRSLTSNPQPSDHITTCGWLRRDGDAVILTVNPLSNNDPQGVDVQLRDDKQWVLRTAAWRCISGAFRPACEGEGACFTSGLRYDWILVEQ